MLLAALIATTPTFIDWRIHLPWHGLPFRASFMQVLSFFQAGSSAVPGLKRWRPEQRVKRQRPVVHITRLLGSSSRSSRRDLLFHYSTLVVILQVFSNI